MAHAFYHAKSSARRFGGQNEDLSTFKELYPDKEECDTWVFIEDLPTDDVTYDFTVIPSLTLPI